MSREVTPGKPTTRRYSKDERDQAVRLVFQLRKELGTSQGTVIRIANQLGYGAESVRRWVAQAECEALGADPWATIASGTLLAAFPPDAADAAVLELQHRGYPAAVIGAVEVGVGVTDADGTPIVWPERDETVRVLAG